MSHRPPFTHCFILQGIGAAVATSFAQQGASVVINYVSPSSKSPAEGVANTIAQLKVDGTQVGMGKVLVVQADLAQLEDIDRLVKETVNRFGKIDILVSISSNGWGWLTDEGHQVNNSGMIHDQPIGEIVSKKTTK